MGFGSWVKARWGRGPSISGLKSSVKGTVRTAAQNPVIASAVVGVLTGGLGSAAVLAAAKAKSIGSAIKSTFIGKAQDMLRSALSPEDQAPVNAVPVSAEIVSTAPVDDGSSRTLLLVGGGLALLVGVSVYFFTRRDK